MYIKVGFVCVCVCVCVCVTMYNIGLLHIYCGQMLVIKLLLFSFFVLYLKCSRLYANIGVIGVLLCFQEISWHFNTCGLMAE